jgi:hypothetical protein
MRKHTTNNAMIGKMVVVVYSAAHARRSAHRPPEHLTCGSTAHSIRP